MPSPVRTMQIRLHKSFSLRPALMSASLVLLLSHAALFAFGKNKVRYEQLEWEYLAGPYFHIYTHNDQGRLPGYSADIVRTAYADLKRRFGFSHRKPVPVIIYGNAALFSQTNVVTDVIPEGVGGFTELFKNRVVVPWTGSYADLRHVIHHELVHAFEFGILYERFGGSFLKNAGLQMPLWFAEGLAEYLSSGWDRGADMFMLDRMVNASVALPGPELNGYMAYKGGQSFFHYLASTHGDSLFNTFLRAFRDTRTVDGAFEKAYGKSIEELGKEWKKQLKRIYWPEIAIRTDPAARTHSLTQKKFKRATYNLRPRISPDGTKVAFFSDLRDFTRIYVTDVKGKEVLATIRQHGNGGFFESFHPFRSGVCWSPDGTRLAFVTNRAGRDEIRIIELEDQSVVATLRFPSLRSLSSPAWSPDGSRLAFTATSLHESDIYLYAFGDSSLQRITDDIACESDPHFSPDGRLLVYGVEEYDMTDTAATQPANSDLALIELATGRTRRLCRTPWNEREPCFAATDSTLVYVSDRNGIANIYHAHLDSLDTPRPLTDFVGSCSSPDWCRETDTLVFTLFQKGSWNIHRIDDPLGDTAIPARLQPTRWVQHLEDSTVAFYEPPPEMPASADSADADRDTTHRESAGNATSGPDSTTADSVSTAIPSTEAKADHGPDTVRPLSESATTDSSITDSTHAPATVTQPDSSAADVADTVRPAEAPVAADSSAAGSAQETAAANDSSAGDKPDTLRGPFPYRLRFSPDLISVGLGVSSLYGYAGQWHVVMSDLMGDHRVAFAGDLQGRLDEYVHLFGSYLNSKYRLAFGIGAFYGRHYTLLGSLYHDTNAGGMLLLRYPFSQRARLQFDCYYSHVEREAMRSSGVSSTYNVLLPTLSYVYDRVVWGLTGPVNGSRAYASATVVPPLESFDAAFGSVEIDVRRYFHFARKFVLATRLSCGAAMPFDDDKRTRRYLLGGTSFWFNYEIDNDGYNENIEDVFYADMVVPFRGWYYYDISGERYAVANIEFRFPFIKEISTVWPLPLRLRYVNGAVFVDIGNAWDPHEQFENVPLPRDIYGGVGFGLRANLGIFVLRYDRAWRTDWTTFIGRPVNYWSLGADF
ncbi:MAG: BamA/TamA family outer membrane protein [Chitinivibrionales bacterium]|nr:BamA/TamA family outer membrane protein [Chitinivibrionales bacterium]